MAIRYTVTASSCPHCGRVIKQTSVCFPLIKGQKPVGAPRRKASTKVGAFLFVFFVKIYLKMFLI
jgi:hypothetical protein